MIHMLGEEGTEQFTVDCYVDGAPLNQQRIHDPFIHTSVVMTFSLWQRIKNVFRAEASNTPGASLVYP